jgi:hypothetical protein
MSDTPGDPQLERLERETSFRPDDPPEVRDALIKAAKRREHSFFRTSLEKRGKSNERH